MGRTQPTFLRFVRRATTLGIAAAALVSTVHAEPGLAGTVKKVSGDVRIECAGKTLAAKVGDGVNEQDRIVTGKSSSVGVTLKDDTLISAGANSQLVVDQFAYNNVTREGGIKATLLKGAMRFISGLIAKRDARAVAVYTPTATIGIRGTDFIVEVPNE